MRFLDEFRGSAAAGFLCLLPWAGIEAGAAEAADNHWPSWRGPRGDGIAVKGQPPVEWSETKNVKWKVALPGKGTSTPVVWKDLVFILAAIPKAASPEARPDSPSAADGVAAMVDSSAGVQQFVVLAYDRASGSESWRRVVREQKPHEGHHRDHGYASASPVTDGETLLAHFGSFGTYGLDFTGKVLWETDLGDMQTRNSFGEGSSPALKGNTVVILWDHEGDDFIVALDKRNGRELWRQTRDEPTGWSTPFVVEHQGKSQVVVNGTRKVRSYDLESGRLLWECAGQTANPIPTPVTANGIVYVTSGFRGSALQAIRLDRSGDLSGTDAIVWSRNRNTPYVPSPLWYDGLLHVFSGNNAMLTLLDAATGEVRVDAERLEGLMGVYASPVGADGRVYLLGRDGGALVIKNAAPLEILAKNRLDDGFDASPAVVGNALFLRGRQSLYCLTAD